MSILLQEARLKELDEEHDLLQSGLQVIEKARKWYFKRITAIQEEKLHLQNQDQYSLEQVLKAFKCTCSCLVELSYSFANVFHTLSECLLESVVLSVPIEL